MIFDCFMIYNELDILDIRLNVLDKYVDKFIIIECELNHAKRIKLLFFKDNIKKFKKFQDKIIHVVIPISECGHLNVTGNRRHNVENFQRNYINKILPKYAKDGDTIIVSDIDEIPNPKTIEQFRLSNHKMVRFLTTLYRFFLNLEFQPWQQGFIAKWRNNLIKFNWSNYRQKVNKTHSIPLLKKHIGWHFSYVDEVNKLFEKMCAYDNQRKFLREVKLRGKHYLKKLVMENTYIHMKQGKVKGKIAPIWKMPFYIQNNKDKFKHLLLETDHE